MASERASRDFRRVTATVLGPYLGADPGRVLGGGFGPIVAISALLFAASTAVTIVWCVSMSAMGEMPMPGGWTMSMAWMRMPGQTWPVAAACFLGMWTAMMVAMMLPSLVPMLWRYCEAVGGVGEVASGVGEAVGGVGEAASRVGAAASGVGAAVGGVGEAQVARRIALVGAGYFAVWAAIGLAMFPLGVALAAVEMEEPALSRAVPIAAGAVVLIAGCLQFTAWKARHLVCCREAPGRGLRLPAGAGAAWRHGLRLGLHCGQCCAGPMAILLVVGVMDLRAMAVVTAAVTVERLAPAGERAARAVGAAAVAAGLFLIARAAGLG